MILDHYLLYLDPRTWDETSYWVMGLLAGGLLFIVLPWLLRHRPKIAQPAVSLVGAWALGMSSSASKPAAGSSSDHNSSGPERRLAQRRKGNAIDVLVSDAKAKSPPIHGQVVDRSLGGLRIALDHALEVGDLYSVRPAAAPASISWVQVEIKHQSQCEEHWEMGCAFVERPPLSVVLLFG